QGAAGHPGRDPEPGGARRGAPRFGAARHGLHDHGPRPERRARQGQAPRAPERDGDARLQEEAGQAANREAARGAQESQEQGRHERRVPLPHGRGDRELRLPARGAPRLSLPHRGARAAREPPDLPHRIRAALDPRPDHSQRDRVGRDQRLRDPAPGGALRALAGPAVPEGRGSPGDRAPARRRHLGAESRADARHDQLQDSEIRRHVRLRAPVRRLRGEHRPRRLAVRREQAMTLRPAIAAALMALIVGGPLAAARSPAAGPAAAAGAAARAEPAPPDSALDHFLGTMSDSTAAFFGPTAAHPDTAGLDSALSYGLAHPRAHDRRGRFELSYRPDLGLSRVDGPVYGGAAAIGRASALGKLEGLIDWAAGPNDMLGGATYRRSSPIEEEAAWSLRLFAGRRTDGMDRDSEDIVLAMLRSFFSGTDYKHYLRRDGFEATLARETGTWRAGAGYRDMLETPVATRAP